MDLHRLLKFQFVERLLLLIISAFVFLDVHAIIDYERNDLENVESLVKAIEYDYHLLSEDSWIDLLGELKLTLDIPEDTERIDFIRSAQHLLPGKRVVWGWITVYPISPTLIFSELPWGTYFCVRFVRSGSNIQTPIYYINDYIEEGDLECIYNFYGFSSVPTIGNISDVLLVDKDLYVQTSIPLSLSIYDLYGNQIYNDVVSEDKIIPLDKYSSQMLIVRYTDSDKAITKKIIVP
ncbi:MAG: T9SS type A sorting domain-containing protein [Muribaculaceae bacterium]|nr:T9SS type A sorting domain-containing protein [Muribaculaceae bacterium]